MIFLGCTQANKPISMWTFGFFSALLGLVAIYALGKVFQGIVDMSKEPKPRVRRDLRNNRQQPEAWEVPDYSDFPLQPGRLNEIKPKAKKGLKS